MPEMEWKKLLSKKRIGDPHPAIKASFGRTEFQVDIDRIIFSSVFRRMSKKTQVHPLAPNDHIHNRLTHSLEVARVGAALGQALGHSSKISLPEDILPSDIGNIVHAACLAHDMGNPPFGHAGESSIKNWFSSYGDKILEHSALEQSYKDDLFHFDGNAQGFRIITQTDNHVFAGGQRLTAATLGTFLKYPWTTKENKKKFGAFVSEYNILKNVAEETGLIPKNEGGWCRHPLAFLTEAADDICYGIIDLEDAVELKIISFSEVFDVLTSSLELEEKDLIKSTFSQAEAHRVNLTRLRGAVFDKLINGAVEAFETAHDDIMRGQFSGDLFSALASDDPRKHIVRAAKELANRKIYGDMKKVEVELGSSSTYASLLDTFCRAALRSSAHLSNPGNTSVDWKSKLVLRLLGDHSPLVSKRDDGESWNDYECIRRVLDFVSGMTDNYAIYVAQQINGAGFTGAQRP